MGTEAATVHIKERLDLLKDIEAASRSTRKHLIKATASEFKLAESLIRYQDLISEDHEDMGAIAHAENTRAARTIASKRARTHVLNSPPADDSIP